MPLSVPCNGSSLNIEYHDFVKIAYVAHGEGEYRCDNEIRKITEGDILIINSNVVHSINSSERADFIEMYYCYFRPENFKTFILDLTNDFPELKDFFESPTLKYLFAIDGSNSEIRNLFVYLIDEYMHCPPGNKHMVKSYFFILMTKILRRHHNAINNPVFNQNRTVDEVIRYINYNLNFGISVHNIAEAFHLSEAYLCRLFKKHMGITLTNYINNLKIEKTKDLLKNTHRSIESLSVSLNCSPTYLKRLFKNHTGMTLMEYRAKYNYKN